MKTSEKRNTFFEELQGTTDEIIKQIKQLIREGNARRLMIKDKNGKVVYQIQLTAGIASTAIFAFTSPVISAVSMAALVMNNFKVIVEKYPEDESGKDEYEVDAEVIIEVEDEEDRENEEKAESEEESGEQQTDKTVGKNSQDSDQ